MTEFAEIRDAVARLCADFPGRYWRDRDRVRAYPREFVEALSGAGYLTVLIPEEYGGSGLGLLDTDARRKARHGEQVLVVPVALGECLRGVGDRHPQLGACREPEVAPHHADDLVAVLDEELS